MAWKHDVQNAGFTDDQAKPWLPISDAHKNSAIDLQEKDAGSFLHFTRKMIAFRKKHAAFKNGDMDFLDSPDDELIAFTRQDDKARFLCLFNLSEKHIDYSLQDFKARKDGAYLAGNDEKSEVYADKVNMKPCRFAIIELG